MALKVGKLFGKFLNGQPELKAEPHQPSVEHFPLTFDNGTSRVHLRTDADGSGVLMVNASRIFHLNPTANTMAKLALGKTPETLAAKQIHRVYDIPLRQAASDYQEFVTSLDGLIRPDNLCPIHDLDLELLSPFSDKPSAPYRMDIALTYRCNNLCDHCYNARVRSFPELSTDDWKSILDKLWDLGIPHIVFTGGEPTLRHDLPELVAHAEKNGQITGINTNGRRLADMAFVQSLVDAGLDHVQITFESSVPEVHDEMVAHRNAWNETLAGLKNVLQTRLFAMTNTTLLSTNLHTLPATLDFLGALGVPTIGLNALIYSGKGASVGTGLKESELPPLLDLAREKTAQYGQKLIWYTPTQYCNFDPVQLELGVKGCTAALYNMCLEPDGSVLPCQSYYQSLGKIQDEPWEAIWNHPLALKLRERRELPEKCHSCSLIHECGGGCPLTFDIPECDHAK
ncbi:MAG TPA: radical SAM protein [Bellilinea sp.]|nr:radical SAM protein [Bellilinea sp.]